MQATLKFNISDLEDRQAYLRCINADNMAYIIWYFMRNSEKLIEQELENNEESFEGIRKCFEHFNMLVEEKSLNIDELVS